MPRDWEETGEAREATDTHACGTGLGADGMRAMQGIESTAPPDGDDKMADETEADTLNLDDSAQITLDELGKPPYDDSQLEYRLGSPHADYQAYRDLAAAGRRHEVGQQAATADSLGDAIETTLAAHRETHGTDDTPTDQYFREKYGAAPYTEAAYPQDDDE
jgi:hypothetical protein